MYLREGSYQDRIPTHAALGLQGILLLLLLIIFHLVNIKVPSIPARRHYRPFLHDEMSLPVQMQYPVREYPVPILWKLSLAGNAQYRSRY